MSARILAAIVVAYALAMCASEVAMVAADVMPLPAGSLLIAGSVAVAFVLWSER